MQGGSPLLGRTSRRKHRSEALSEDPSRVIACPKQGIVRALKYGCKRKEVQARLGAVSLSDATHPTQ